MFQSLLIPVSEAVRPSVALLLHMLLTGYLRGPSHRAECLPIYPLAELYLPAGQQPNYNGRNEEPHVRRPRKKCGLCQ